MMDAQRPADARSNALDAAVAIFLGLFIVSELALPTNVGLETGAFLLTPARLAIALAFAAALVASIVRRSVPELPDRRFLLPWLVYLGAVLASLAIHPSGAGAARLGSLVLEGPVLFVLVWGVARHAPTGRRLEWTLIGTTIVTAALTVVLAWLGLRYDEIVRVPFDRLSELIVTVRFGLIRQTGPFDAPLFYATWLLTVSALVLPRIALGTGVRRALWTFGWIVLAAAVLLTTSRLALAALPLVVAAFLAARVSIRPALASAAAGLLAAAILFTLPSTALLPGTPSASPSVASSPATSPEPATGSGSPSGGQSSPAPPPSPTAAPPTIDSTEGSNQARFEALGATITAVRESPLVGWGPLSGRATAERILGHQNAIDNAYLVIAIESGLVGLAGFLVILAVVVLAAVTRRHDAMSTGRVLGLLAFLVMSMIAAVFSVTQLYAAFWVLAALTIAAPTAPTDRPIDRPGDVIAADRARFEPQAAERSDPNRAR